MGQRGDLLSIGQFAATCRLSLRALRLYDDVGILRPALVDPDSGYRYYRPEQSRDALLIRLLRELDLPLDEIGRIVHADSRADARARLGHLWADAERRFRLRQRSAAYLNALLAEEQMEESSMSLQVTVRDVPSQQVVSRTARPSIATLGDHIRGSKDALAAHVRRAGLVAAGAPIVIFHGKVDEESDGPVEVCLPVAGAATGADRIETGELAGGSFAVAVLNYEQFEFPEVLAAYDEIATWVHKHGRELIGPPREIHLVPLSEVTSADGRPVAEIHWPIR